MPQKEGIYYYASRSGRFNRPAVILIHGAGGNNRQWPYPLRTLAGYRTFAVDLPGHGNSGGVGQQSIAQYADIIERWALDIGISRAVYIGHSMGGAIALQMALGHRDRTAGLVLIGSGARLRVSPEILEGLALEMTHAQTVDHLIEMHFSRSARSEMARRLRDDLMDCRRSVLLGDFQACDAFDLTRRLGDIRVPTCVLCGEEDVLTPPKYARFLAENISDAELNLFPSAGHLLTWEQPQRAAAVIEKFMLRLA
jgi:pimeloyl-ACP methyl ester carboxylesterase